VLTAKRFRLLGCVQIGTEGAIVDIGRTVLVLSPWNDPIPLTRAWCLYEMFSTLSAPDVRFDIVLPDSELTRLRAAVQSDDGVCVVVPCVAVLYVGGRRWGRGSQL